MEGARNNDELPEGERAPDNNNPEVLDNPNPSPNPHPHHHHLPLPLQLPLPLSHHHHHPQPPPPPPRCPRCDSSNTKFCYYNNYSLAQPRYFCKACRRYWTQGGTLRNVPVGGGSRKNKRPRTSGSPSSSHGGGSGSGSGQRTQGLSTAASQPPNPTVMIPGQSSRAAAPLLPPSLGGSYYGGGSFLSSLAAMQSNHASGISHGAAMMGGGSRFGANMALLQGMTFPSLKAPAPPYQHTSQPPPHFFQPQQSLNLAGRFGSWTQSMINGAGASSSSSSSASGAWSSNGGGSSGQAGSSFAPNQWSDSNPGFNPSQ